MAKISVSIPDDLAGELRTEAVGNVSRFVSSAVRDALDRRRLLRALEALDAELGPVSTDLLDEAEAVFGAVDTANENRIPHASGLASRGGAIRTGRSQPEHVRAGARTAKSSKVSTKKPPKTASAQPAKRRR